jgi:hypothetical protein
VDVARRRRLALGLVAVTAWLGVLLQLYLSIRLALGGGRSLVGGNFVCFPCWLWYPVRLVGELVELSQAQ